MPGNKLGCWKLPRQSELVRPSEESMLGVARIPGPRFQGKLVFGEEWIFAGCVNKVYLVWLADLQRKCLSA